MLEAITPEQWAEVLTGPVYFAFYLSKASVTDDLAVDSLSITGDAEYWALAGDDDATWGYPAADTLQVRLLTNGSYKINILSGS